MRWPSATRSYGTRPSRSIRWCCAGRRWPWLPRRACRQRLPPLLRLLPPSRWCWCRSWFSRKSCRVVQAVPVQAWLLRPFPVPVSLSLRARGGCEEASAPIVRGAVPAAVGSARWRRAAVALGRPGWLASSSCIPDVERIVPRRLGEGGVDFEMARRKLGGPTFDLLPFGVKRGAAPLHLEDERRAAAPLR